MTTMPVRGETIVSMEEAVGYAQIGCEHETPIENGLVLKHDRYFLLVDSHGDIVPPGRCALGLFRDDTRVLSHYGLTVCGGPPSLLSAQTLTSYSAQIDLAVSDRDFGGRGWDPKSAVHIRREILIADRMIERVTFTNHLVSSIDFWVELRVGADFADIFEVRGWKRPRRGTFLAPEVDGDAIRMAYRGRDGGVIRTRIVFREMPTRLEARVARWEATLEPKGQLTAEWEVVAATGDDGDAIFPASRRDAHRTVMAQTYAHWRSQCSRWTSDVATLNSTLARSIDDLRALYVEVDGADVISAGIPWYSTVFGRDSIITSLETLAVQPQIATDTLRYLAIRQGKKEDPFTEEQPGKIMHELRRGEMARTGEIPHVPYYGTIDATPLWLILLSEAWRWTGDDDLLRSLMPNAERALTWIDRYGDIDGDGFVEYARTSEKGLVNQGWKDSGDGVPFPDGTLPHPPIALIEVQGYVYDAKVRMSALYAALGDLPRAEALGKEAEALRRRIEERFWVEELGTFALALDGDKRPIPTSTSNAGHTLWSRVPTLERAASIGNRLLARDMFSGWGIRTLSASHPVYNPMSYHNGSVWPHDNAIIVVGLAMHGMATAAMPVVSALHMAAVQSESQRLPELFCGMTRAHGMRPVQYPVSCLPQAWASAAMFMILQGMLGIYPEAPAGVLHIRNPVLPDFMGELAINGMAVGQSRVSLQFRRHGTRTLANLIDSQGAPLQVRIELG
jgi:glycogen debranching enzyme